MCGVGRLQKPLYVLFIALVYYINSFLISFLFLLLSGNNYKECHEFSNWFIVSIYNFHFFSTYSMIELNFEKKIYFYSYPLSDSQRDISQDTTRTATLAVPTTSFSNNAQSTLNMPISVSSGELYQPSTSLPASAIHMDDMSQLLLSKTGLLRTQKKNIYLYANHIIILTTILILVCILLIIDFLFFDFHCVLSDFIICQNKNESHHVICYF